MSILYVLLLAATGASPADSSGQPAAASAATAAAQPAARTPQEWRHALAAALHQLNSAKGADRAAAVENAVTLFNDLGHDRQLSAAERQRMGAELRARLLRYATQLQSEKSRAALRTPVPTSAGEFGGPAADGMDQLVDLIQKTIRPDDWVLAQRIGQPGANGQQGNLNGQQQQGAGGGGAFGNNGFDQQADANGQALVDVIQNTVAPETWDVRGGPGSIVYYNHFRALVVRQTGDVQDDLGGLLAL